jgi:signal transduction histidine kinase
MVVQRRSPAPAQVRLDNDLESGSADNEFLALKLNKWRLRFESVEVEAEYQSKHKISVVKNHHGLAVFFCFTAGVLFANVGEMKAALNDEPGNWRGLIVCVFCSITLAMLICGRFRARELLGSQWVVIGIFSSTLMWLMLNPLFSAMLGACRLDQETLEPGLRVPLCCDQLRAGGAPFGSICAAVLAPFLLTIACGLQWSAVVALCVTGSVADIVFIGMYMVKEHDAIKQYNRPLLLLSSFVTTVSISLYFSWEIARQDREKFVWRKMALSEAKLEHERTFNAFLCHEIRNPFAVVKGFAQSTLADVEGAAVGVAEVERVVQNLHHILTSCDHIQQVGYHSSHMPSSTNCRAWTIASQILDNSLDLSKLEQHKVGTFLPPNGVRLCSNSLCGSWCLRMRRCVSATSRTKSTACWL